MIFVIFCGESENRPRSILYLFILFVFICIHYLTIIIYIYQNQLGGNYGRRHLSSSVDFFGFKLQ